MSESAERKRKRVLVVGGTGRVGRRVATALRADGHDVRIAARSRGVDVITGEGLDAAMVGVDTVVDVLNAPQRSRVAASGFFTLAGRRMRDAEDAAGVDHHVLLSVVGADEVSTDGYFVGKDAQETALDWGHTPYTVVRSTQFQEFLPVLADRMTQDGVVECPPLMVQPVAVDDLVTHLVTATTSSRLVGGVTQVAGPERMPLTEAMETVLRGVGDSRLVRSSASSPAFGGARRDGLLPIGPYLRGETTLAQSLRRAGTGA